MVDFSKLKSPWENNENPVWLGSTLRLLRNIENYSFPAKLGAGELGKVYAHASQELLECDLESPQLVEGETLSPVQKDFLHEHFLSSRPFHQVHGGEGFVIDESGRFFAQINLRDHLQLQLIDTSHDLEGVWNRLSRIEIQLGKRLKYAFSERFGFMTAAPAQSGTGLHIALYLQVPGLIHLDALQSFFDENEDPSIDIRGLQGEDAFLGDVVILRNRYSLGVTEEQILSSVRILGTKLMVRENGIQEEELDNEAKDKVSRAFGLLKHSYQTGAGEVLDAISLLKLGVRFGWVKGVSISELNRLFFDCRRGHLLTHLGEEFSKEELLHARAEFIHQAVEKTVLTI